MGLGLQNHNLFKFFSKLMVCMQIEKIVSRVLFENLKASIFGNFRLTQDALNNGRFRDDCFEKSGNYAISVFLIKKNNRLQRFYEQIVVLQAEPLNL